MKRLILLKEKKMEKGISATVYLKSKKLKKFVHQNVRMSTKKGIWKMSVKSLSVRKKRIPKQ